MAALASKSPRIPEWLEYAPNGLRRNHRLTPESLYDQRYPAELPSTRRLWPRILPRKHSLPWRSSARHRLSAGGGRWVVAGLG